MKSHSGHSLNLRSLVLGIVVAVVGVLVLLAGATTQQLWLGVIGFLVMLGGVLLVFGRSSSATDEGKPGAPKSGGRSSSSAGARASLSERMERRWDERMEGDR